MTAYVAIVEKEPQTAWGAWFPDCPGCTTMASTMQEVVQTAAEALRLWSEGLVADGDPLPTPRSMDELRGDSEVSAALAKGDVAILVPLVIEQGRTVRASVSIDAGLLEAIDDAPRSRGVTRSVFLANAAREKLLAGS